jgi:hypothetical protein
MSCRRNRGWIVRASCQEGLVGAFANALENSSMGVWVRESGSIWSYPTIIFFHSAGMGLLVGLSAMIDLRLLGFARDIPLAPLRKLFPLLWIGFWVNAISGVLLLMADASTFMAAPLFGIKIALIVAAIASMQLIRRQLPVERGGGLVTVTGYGKVLAAASLLFWTAALTAGRLTAYIGPAVALKEIAP